MIRLTTRGPVVVRDDEWITQQRELARRHCVVFRDFVDASILERVPRMLETSRFFTSELLLQGKNKAAAREVLMYDTEPLACMFFFLVNQPRLFEAMTEFTGCEMPIRYFIGRFRKQLPGGEGFRWHDDRDRKRERLVGLSINLSPEPFVGGNFRIRNKETGEILRAVAASRFRFGDAILFRIHDSLEHALSVVRGGPPRYNYVGWFTWARDYRKVLREKAGPV